MINYLNSKLAFPVLASVLVLGVLFIPQTAYACDFVKHPEKCVEDKIKEVIRDVVRPAIDAVAKDVQDVERDAKHDIDAVENEVKSLEGDLVKEVETIGKDVKDIINDAEKIEHTLVTDVKTDLKVIKDDVKKIANFVEDVDKTIENTVTTTERIIKLLESDLVLYFKYILIGIVVLLAALVGIKIYEIVMKHIEKDRFYKLEENVAEMVKLVSKLVVNDKTAIR